MNKLILYILFATAVFCYNKNDSYSPDGRFQPILRECLYSNQNPLLAAAFKNYSFMIDTYFSHGSVIAARCKYFGLNYLGDNKLRCENGEWFSKIPKCVPIANYTGGALPIFQNIAAARSPVLEVREDSYMNPGNTAWLDCPWPGILGKPFWSWPLSYRHYASILTIISAIWAYIRYLERLHKQVLIMNLKTRFDRANYISSSFRIISNIDYMQGNITKTHPKYVYIIDNRSRIEELVIEFNPEI